MECVFPIVIWSLLRVGQYRYDHHHDDAPHFTFTDEPYKDSDREKQKIEAKIKKMRSSTSCWRSNNNDGERLKEYLASRDKMNEVITKIFKVGCVLDGHFVRISHGAV